MTVFFAKFARQISRFALSWVLLLIYVLLSPRCLFMLKSVGRDIISSYFNLFGFDVDDFGLDLFRFWQGDGQDAVLKLSFGFV
jgi:hypothetical protein